MCGIIGYTGARGATAVLLESLHDLEYRGYDSAGIATVSGDALHVRKCVGRVADLQTLVDCEPAPGTCGIGHTRWATHGGISDRNAHPHTGGNAFLAVVHNGVIENYASLRKELQTQGVVFVSETDTEVIPHLIARAYDGDLVKAVHTALERLVGTYAIAVVSKAHPGMVVGARLGSPLVLGVGKAEHFLASDPTPLANWTNQVVYLADHQMAVIEPERWQVLDRTQMACPAQVQTFPWHAADAEKHGYPHFMLKEIHEQPEALTEALRGRFDESKGMPRLEGLAPELLERAERVVMLACGTSYHAALVGKCLFENLAGLPAEVEIASEYRYRAMPMSRPALAIALSQSGETADTLGALQAASGAGFPTLGLCNVPGSTMAREAADTLYLRSGPEIAVASTKVFSSQVLLLALLALYAARRHGAMTIEEGRRRFEELGAIPECVRRTLRLSDAVKCIARKYSSARCFLFMGRQYLFPLALEGALKLKEISYLPAEGYPAGEMKHGPIALVDPDTPSVFLVSNSASYKKVMSNVEEVRARRGPVIAIAREGDTEISARADDVLFVPSSPDYLQPLIAAIPLQLLAYHMGVLRGCDVDKPRNLAKSVTVE